MEKHPQLTLRRIKRLIEELEGLLWADRVPLEAAVFQSIEPVAYTDALRAGYESVAAPYTWGPAWSTAWFCLRGEWPESWGGARVAALVSTGSEALVWDRIDGVVQPAQGLDENRSDYVLHRAAPHNASAEQRRVELYIEAAGNQLFGEMESFTFKPAYLARLDVPSWDLYHDLLVLHNLAENLDELAPRRAQLIQTMNDAVNAYRAIGGGAEACRRVQAVLAPAFAVPADPALGSVAALGHSHIDVAWLWPLRETRRKANRTFSTVLKYLEDYPEYRYVQSQPQLYAWIKEQQPALYERIKRAVAAGQWEPQGMMWVEADCNVPSGESFVRQILYGTRFIEQEFGIKQNVLWLPDVFGYSAALPQIMLKCGMHYFMTQKISWNQTNKFPHHTFIWEGIDGSQALAHFPPADTYCGDMTPNELLRGHRNYKDHGRADTWLYLFGHGDGGGGATRGMLETARRIEDLNGLPKVKQVFSRDWFPQLSNASQDLRVWSGELYLEYHRGTLTTQAHNKRENRRCEALLRETEHLCCAAWALSGHAGYVYPVAAVEEAWKLVLLNQFHDILPGSSIHWVYEDSARDYAKVHQLCHAAQEEARRCLGGMLPPAEGMRALVFNPLGFERSGIAVLPEGVAHAAAADGAGLTTQPGEGLDGPCTIVELPKVPAAGWAALELNRVGAASLAYPDVARAGGLSLENGRLLASFNERGELLSLYDKQAGREVLLQDQPGNELQLFDDRPINWDAWDIDPYFEDVRLPAGQQAQATIVEAGPLRVALRIERQLTPKSRLVQLIRLASGSARLDFETWIDWHEEHVLLKAAFPLALRCQHATYEIQYGCVERPTCRNTSWDWARFEVAAQRWASLCEPDYGAALLNDGKYGYDCHESTLRLSLLRAPKYPDATADMGEHRFTYSLLLLPGGLGPRVIEEAQALNSPLAIHPLPAGGQGGALLPASFFKLDGGLVLDAVKRAEDGQGVIVRLYEPLGCRGTAQLSWELPFSQAALCNLLEGEHQPLPHAGGKLKLAFQPFEIITLRLS